MLRIDNASRIPKKDVIRGGRYQLQTRRRPRSADTWTRNKLFNNNNNILLEARFRRKYKFLDKGPELLFMMDRAEGSKRTIVANCLVIRANSSLIPPFQVRGEVTRLSAYSFTLNSIHYELARRIEASVTLVSRCPL